jgi:hypothetical protein
MIKQMKIGVCPIMDTLGLWCAALVTYTYVDRDTILLPIVTCRTTIVYSVATEAHPDSTSRAKSNLEECLPFP